MSDAQQIVRVLGARPNDAGALLLAWQIIEAADQWLTHMGYVAHPQAKRLREDRIAELVRARITP